MGEMGASLNRGMPPKGFGFRSRLTQPQKGCPQNKSRTSWPASFLTRHVCGSVLEPINTQLHSWQVQVCGEVKEARPNIGSWIAPCGAAEPVARLIRVEDRSELGPFPLLSPAMFAERQ